MNRTVIIVKEPNRNRWALVSLHWQYGQEVEQWLSQTSPDWRSAWSLIEQGHRSTIAESRVDLGADERPEYMTFRTLAEAKSSWEYYTIAWHNGKRWRFKHER